MKMCSVSYIIKDCKLKQRDAITHLLKWQKSKTLTASNISENMGQRNSHPLLVGKPSVTATLETCMALSYKATPTVPSSSDAPRYFPK